MTQVNRYHPLLVVLHWLLAIIVIATLTLGAVVMVHIPNDVPRKLEALRNHMIGGALILILMSLRLAIRQLTAIPAPAPTGSRFLDALAWASHRGFYALIFAQVATGAVMAVQARLPQLLLLGEPGHLPATFWIYTSRGLHYFFSRALMLLIALHLGGVAYHLAIRKDHLLRRMWFGRRLKTSTTEAAPSGATSTR